VRDYNDRYRRITRAAVAMQREQVRLERQVS
jgi:hypothetical protein